MKLLGLIARLRSTFAGAGPVALTTPLLGAVALLAALTGAPPGGHVL